jgi:hypothetical protein
MELSFGLHPGQQAIYNSTALYKVVAAGRRFGKTILAAICCIVAALSTHTLDGLALHNDSEVMYMAPTFDQAKGIFWPVLQEYARPLGPKCHENTGIMTLPNGVRIRLKGMDNPDRARGYKLRYAVMDEYADMPAAAWTEIIQPALMDVDGGALFIGTPKGKNHFYNLFMAALTGEAGDDWEAFNFSSKDNPTLSQKAVERLFNDDHYTEELRRQELEASFISTGGGELDPNKLVFTTREPSDGYYVVAVDLAGFTSQLGGKSRSKKRLDESAIAIVKICKAGWWIKEVVHGQWDTRETALRIILAARSVDATKIGVEKGSLMNAALPYLEDTMIQYGYWRNIEPLTHGNQKKQERILWAMQGRLEKRRLMINCDPDLSTYDRPGWVQALMGQMGDFPDPLAHDDLLDCVAYVDQMGSTIASLDWSRFEETPDADYDDIIGW